jgi:transcriptional regulator GlxA family with amidase domain
MLHNSDLHKTVASILPPTRQPFALPDVEREGQRTRGALSPRVLRLVREYIHSHLEEKISNKTLAMTAGLSVWHFAREFKRLQGLSPHRYVMECRIRRTQELLAETELPLCEIAIATGFSDQSHYTRCFSAIVGVTPSSYRWSLR